MKFPSPVNFYRKLRREVFIYAHNNGTKNNFHFQKNPTSASLITQKIKTVPKWKFHCKKTSLTLNDLKENSKKWKVPRRKL